MARPAGQREHLLLAARQGAGHLGAPLGEPREALVGLGLDVGQPPAGVGDHAGGARAR